MTELSALQASLAGLDWAGAWKGPFPADDPIPGQDHHHPFNHPFLDQDVADGLSAACQDASDFMAGLAEGFDTKGIAEAKVLSPLDFAAFFSDIATYDYQILGHQISKLFSALDRVDWAQVLFTLTGKVVGSDPMRSDIYDLEHIYKRPMRSDIRYYKAGFEVASKAADLVADGVSGGCLHRRQRLKSHPFRISFRSRL